MSSGLAGGNRYLLPQVSPCRHGELGPAQPIFLHLEERPLFLRSLTGPWTIRPSLRVVMISVE